ncbi:MAG TPA: hypothetical protein VF175_08915 [Lacipirellula sp.]
MGRINETVRTVNSAVRTFLFAVLVGAAALGGWKAYSIYNEPQEKLAAKQRDLEAMTVRWQDAAKRSEELSGEVERQKAEIAKLETSNRLLKLRHRIAQIRVIDQQDNPDTGRPRTEIEFFEVNEEGAPLNDKRQKFTIDGDRVYVECLLAKFDDKYIEANDLDRRTAICLFQRVFGEHQEPHEGFEIDQVGTAPTSYERGGQMSEFEKRIWRDFWTLANDPEEAAKIGIRAVHADAPSLRVEKGGLYELELRTTGEFTFRRVSEPVEASS